MCQKRFLAFSKDNFCKEMFLNCRQLLNDHQETDRKVGRPDRIGRQPKLPALGTLSSGRRAHYYWQVSMRVLYGERRPGRCAKVDHNFKYANRTLNKLNFAEMITWSIRLMLTTFEQIQSLQPGNQAVRFPTILPGHQEERL